MTTLIWMILGLQGGRYAKLWSIIHRVKGSTFTFAPSFSTGGFMFAPALYGDYGHIVLCKKKKGFFHRNTDHVKHFYHKHKKPLLIGVAVVVAAVVVAVVVLAPASGPALEAAAAVAAAAAADKAASSSHKDDPPPLLAANEFAPVQSIINDQISSVKEVIAETPIPKSTRDSSFVDATREMGSFLAHQVLDGVGQLASIILRAWKRPLELAQGIGLRTLKLQMAIH